MKSLSNAAVPLPRPTTSYVVTLSLGCAAIAFTGLTLGGELLAFHGRDTLASFNSYGLFALLLAFAIMFASRLIFQQGCPEGIRMATRIVIFVVLAVGIIATIPGLILAWMLPEGTRHGSMPKYFGMLAAITQLGTAAWLLRYRTEPDN